MESTGKIRAFLIMARPLRLLRFVRVVFLAAPAAAAVAIAACAQQIDPTDALLASEEPATGGTSGSAGGSQTSGNGAKAGANGTGGALGKGGSAGGSVTAGRGGAPGAGGSVSPTGSAGTTGATGGTLPTAGRGGGSAGTLGRGMAGRSGTGGRGGAASTGGTPTAGASSGGGVLSGDACSMTTALTGGMQHPSSNASGKAAGLDWTIWSNGSGGSITTYSTPGFSAAWNNSGDFLARMGLQWNDSKTYDQYGTITAEYAAKKTGSGGGYSYIGMYGWSVSPCIEWYIVDDSYSKMPVNPGSTTNKGTAMIDGGAYTLYTRPTSGTGGSKCSGVSSWTQFYSVRQTARDCGQISVTAHFDAWKAAGMTLGKMDQAQILVEVGGGSGSIDFTDANITTTM